MKLIVFILLLLPASARAADDFSLKSQDKQLHIAAAYGCSLTSTLLLEKYGVKRSTAVLFASAFTMLLGASKELFIDDVYSSGDQIANTIGIAGSAAMVFVFEF